ncbi:MAG: zinc ribbon domain-containing protein [Clostridia bacterium]|nr:zinc ribbon domain-containing protein [Clostridia bacterium]
MTICRKCGTSNKDEQKFCSFCHELLIEDPEELAKREKAAQKKAQKAEKKQKRKLWRWKNALLLLISIGVLDFLDVVLCLDLLFLGIGQAIGTLFGDMLASFLGYTTEIFGNLVYTEQLVTYVVRGLEILGAAGLLVIACVLSVIMITYMIKWHKYKNQTPAQNDIPEKAEESHEQAFETSQRVEEIKSALGEAAVSYCEFSEMCENRTEYEMPVPVKQIDCKTLYTALQPHLWEYDHDSVRRILSAMSCSRLLLCSAGALDSASIFDSLSRAFGSKAAIFTKEDMTEESEESRTLPGLAGLLLVRGQQSEVAEHSAFAKALYMARFAPQNICLAGVRGVGASELGERFLGLESYFRLPDGGTALYLGNPAAPEQGKAAALPEGIADGKLVLSSNVWMINVLPESDHASNIGSAMGEYCAVLYLRNSQSVFPPEELEQLSLPSVAAWENAVAVAEKEYYISEELWRVLDLVEEQMLALCGNRFSNRTLRMLERYTSVYMACGGKQSEAFDNGFAAILVPAYTEQLRALAKREDGEALSALLERTVGRDRLPVTMEALSSIGLI